MAVTEQIIEVVERGRKLGLTNADSTKCFVLSDASVSFIIGMA